jgi:hypothetical protein
MKNKSNKKEINKSEADISFIIKDWNENHEEYSKMFNVNLDFNEFLKFCIDKYTIIPK